MFSLLRTLAACLIVSITCLCAQGNTAVEASGIVLVKPQPWSKPAEAELVTFTAYTDRSARGSAGAGYFVLRLPSGKESQIPTSRIVKLILKPVAPKDLINDTQRANLQKIIDEMGSYSKVFPATQVTIGQYLKPLQEIASRFDSGEVMEASAWQTREKYRQASINKIESRLRLAMLEAKIKKDFDLTSNADFNKLSAFAKEDSALEARLVVLEADYAKLVSREDQDAILAKLQSPMSPQEGELLINKLKEFPDPSPRTVSVLKQADVAAGITAEIDSIKLAWEQSWNTESLAKGTVPNIPSSLTERLDAIASKIKVFRAGSPPAGIWIPTSAFDAFIAVKNAMPSIQTGFNERNFRSTLQVFNTLSPVARQVGPKTVEAIGALQSYANTEIQKFSALVEEGNTFLTAQEKTQAITKFREALVIMPDEDLEKRITSLQ
jgi:hypothetical protein